MYIKKYSYNFNSKKYICKVILGFERIVQEYNWIFFKVAVIYFYFGFSCYDLKKNPLVLQFCLFVMVIENLF